MKELAGRPQDGIDIESCESSLMSRSDGETIDWSLTTWEGAEREQLRRWARLSLEEIVLAQEEMQNVTERLAATRRPGSSQKST